MDQELDMEPKRSDATIDQMLGVVHQVPEDQFIAEADRMVFHVSLHFP